MRTRIKFCGLTREADVEAAAEVGADAVGFVFFEKSPRAVSAARAKALARHVAPWMSIVGLFVNASASQIRALADEVGLSHLQLHGDETPEQCMHLGRPVIKAIRIDAQTQEPALVKSIQAYADCDALLFDADSEGFGGSGHSFDWSLIAPLASSLRGRWVLSGGLHEQSVSQAIALLAPPALDVSSGIELLQQGQTVKGVKDAQRMQAFMRAVAQADQERNGA